MIINLKSNDEVNEFVEVGRATAEVMAVAINNLKEGISGNDIDNIINDECLRHGGQPAFLNYKGFPGACCFSVNEALVHGIPTATCLKKGDVVSLDIGVCINGFYGDHAITIEIDDNKHRKIIDTCKRSLYEVINTIKPGMMFSSIPKIIQENSGNFKIIKDYGGHGVSHGILHDEPFIPNVDNFILDDFVLRENMIFAIEPMLTYESDFTKVGNDGWTVYTKNVSVHFEHMILMTKNGVKVLTEV